MRATALFLTIAMTTTAAAIPTSSADCCKTGRETGLPLPRFVSLATDPARMRFGPGFKYDVKYIYTARGLPLQIFQEFDNWRRVRDPEGDTGWMHSSLLSAKRTGVVVPPHNDILPLRKLPGATSTPQAYMEPGLLVDIISCDDKWCRVSAESGTYQGYVSRGLLWGSG
ncbi:MAG: SH3 domain-containing protein [Rhodanobacter sp.]